MKILSTQRLYVTTREAWRDWLEKHHESEEEIWLIYYKKHSGRPRIPYDHAVEEALCYGWIDSTIQRLDENRFAQRFTPRRKGSNWSQLNLQRMRKLIKEAQMTAAGLAKIDPRLLKNAPSEREKRHLVVPASLTEALAGHPEAAACFASLAPSHRRHYSLWIASAKREETKARRVQEALRLLQQKQKLGLK